MSVIHCICRAPITKAHRGLVSLFCTYFSPWTKLNPQIWLNPHKFRQTVNENVTFWLWSGRVSQWLGGECWLEHRMTCLQMRTTKNITDTLTDSVRTPKDCFMKYTCKSSSCTNVIMTNLLLANQIQSRGIEINHSWSLKSKNWFGNPKNFNYIWWPVTFKFVLVVWWLICQ